MGFSSLLVVMSKFEIIKPLGNGRKLIFAYFGILLCVFLATIVSFFFYSAPMIEGQWQIAQSVLDSTQYVLTCGNYYLAPGRLSRSVDTLGTQFVRVEDFRGAYAWSFQINGFGLSIYKEFDGDILYLAAEEKTEGRLFTQRESFIWNYNFENGRIAISSDSYYLYMLKGSLRFLMYDEFADFNSQANGTMWFDLYYLEQK